MADGVVKLADVLDQGKAEGLRAEILAHRQKDVVVDASTVTRPGTLCLQVLLSAAKSWAADGRSFRITRASPAFTEAMGTLGISPAQLQLKDPS